MKVLHGVKLDKILHRVTTVLSLVSFRSLFFFFIRKYFEHLSAYCLVNLKLNLDSFALPLFHFFNKSVIVAVGLKLLVHFKLLRCVLLRKNEDGCIQARGHITMDMIVTETIGS